MNRDLKTRIRAKRSGYRLWSAVELFGKHKKHAGKPGIMEMRPGYMHKIGNKV